MFCQQCGAQVNDAAQFCGTCGKPIGSHSAAVQSGDPLQRLSSHVRTIGILWAVYAAFRVLMGVWTLAFSRLMLPMISGVFARSAAPFPFPFPLVEFLRTIYLAAFILGVLAGILGSIAAWGLLQREPWGRTMALVVAFISLISIPFGTALGVYTLVILLPSAAGHDYERIRATT